MRAGVSITTLKRLARIEQLRGSKRPRAAFPPLLGLDEWEAEAMATQEALLIFTRDSEGFGERDKPVVSPFPDVSHKYKPGARMFGINVVNR